MPDERNGCVGSPVNTHSFPLATSWGASTWLTKSVLSSWAHADTTTPPPATNVTPAKTCPKTRFMSILPRHPRAASAPTGRARARGRDMTLTKKGTPAPLKSPKTWWSGTSRSAPQRRRPQVRERDRVNRRSTRARDDGQAQHVSRVFAGALLVARNEVPSRSELGRIHARRQSQGGQGRHRSVHEVARRPSQGCRRLHLRLRSHSDGLPVQPSRVPALCFERVAQRVPEVEQRTRTGLALIVAHDSDLRLDGRAHHGKQRAVIPPRELPRCGLDAVEQRRVGRERDLRDLRESGLELARRQSRQVMQVGDDRARLVERADQVLSRWVVEPRLTPDRRVHHREQRR